MLLPHPIFRLYRSRYRLKTSLMSQSNAVIDNQLLCRKSHFMALKWAWWYFFQTFCNNLPIEEMLLLRLCWNLCGSVGENSITYLLSAQCTMFYIFAVDFSSYSLISWYRIDRKIIIGSAQEGCIEIIWRRCCFIVNKENKKKKTIFSKIAKPPEKGVRMVRN